MSANFAMTADGKIAFDGGKFVPFGSKHDLKHLYELRATADAIICGAGTIQATGTILGNGGEEFRKQRVKNGLAEFPLRIVVSGSGSIDLNANLFEKRFSPIIILTTARVPKVKLKALDAVAKVKICGKDGIDFPAALRWLRAKWNVERLLCEGGGELNGALIRAGLLDELHLTICPKIFGGRNAPDIAGSKGLARLADAQGFELASLKRVGDEIFTIWRCAGRR